MVVRDKYAVITAKTPATTEWPSDNWYTVVPAIALEITMAMMAVLANAFTSFDSLISVSLSDRQTNRYFGNDTIM